MTIKEIKPESIVITDFQKDILKLKQFGSFSNQSPDSSSLLFKSCFLYHRLHYNSVLDQLNIEKLKVIKQDAVKLLKTINNDKDELLSTCILNNVIGVINVIIVPEDNSLLLENYTTLRAKNFDCCTEYVTLLILENIYYTNSLANLLNDSAFQIPLLESPMSLYYLNRICEKLESVDVIKSPFLKFYCQITLRKTKDEEVIAFFDSLIKDVSFPNASEINENIQQINLDGYLQILLNHYDSFDKENADQWEYLVTSIIGKTFQNIFISGVAAKLFHYFGDLSKSELFFANYMIYNEKYLEFNKCFKDIVAILNLANKIEAKTTIIDFVSKIYDLYKLDTCSKTDSLLILENSKFDSVKIPDVVNEILVESWNVLYAKADINKHMDDAFYYLGNLLQLRLDQNSKLVYDFEYSYNLSLVKQNDRSCTWLKERILNVKPEDNVKCWLLLAIVESSKEEKMNSLTISNTILSQLEVSEDEEEFTDVVNVSKLSFEQKYHYIIFKFLQIDIVTEIHSIKDSLELLPSLFELYEFLFSESSNAKISAHNPRFTKEYVLQLVWLQASKMYLLNGQDSEALNCLKEISNMDVAFKNLNCISMKGFINKDISQFETVLGYEPTNLIALKGLSDILLSQDNNNSLEYKNRLSNLSLKITTAINNNIQSQFNGQLQFNLYKLYVKLGHSNELQKNILLTTIQNLENDTILDPWILKLM